MKTLDLILAIVAALTVAFTVTMIVIFCRYAVIPDTLVTCWFTCIVFSIMFNGSKPSVHTFTCDSPDGYPGFEEE